MRKQYHLRRTQRGFDAWDIDKLVEASKSFPVVTVDLDEIKELDENFWYNGPDNIPTCRSIAVHFQLVQEADLSYPVILSGDKRVMDGMHRIVRALNLGHKTIDAVIIENIPPPDFTDVNADDLPY
jgi:hypothetical protein